MSKSKRWKVYCYTNKINGKKYVGITCTSFAARAGHHGRKYIECPYFGNAIKKYGWDSFSVEILKEGLNREEVGIAEDFYIELFHTRDPQFGYNIRRGGYHHGELSPEGRQRFIESHSGKNSFKARRTAVYDLSGSLIKVFDTATDAAKYLGVSDVTEVCKSKRGTMGNSIVRYESDYPGVKQLSDDEIYRKYDFRLQYRPIAQYDLCGNLIQVFPSVKKAAEAVSPSGKGSPCISACAHGRQQSAYGFIWRFCVGDCNSAIPPMQPRVFKSGSELPQSVRVRQLSLDGDFIAEFDSIKEAHEKTGASCNAIQNQLSGKTKRPIKYRWERID